MKLASFAASLAVVAFIALAGSPAAYAQSTSHQNKQNNKPKPVMVEVNPGDTLDGIATTHQTTYVRVFDANSSISDPNLIYPTQQVRIPASNEQLPDRQLPADAAPVAAAAPAQTQPVATTYHPAAPSVQSAPVAGCGDNQYANYIYMHESGCRTTAMSPNGCYGIGQACPASKIAYCGADYACQNAYFTAYAGKYGGWAGAYAFWVSNGWW